MRNDPAIKTSAVNDPGYQKASALRTYADMLDTLLIAGENGSPDWMAIKSHETSGCIAVRIAFEQIQKSIKLDHKHAGGATRRALAFAKKGIEVRILDARYLRGGFCVVAKFTHSFRASSNLWHLREFRPTYQSSSSR